MGKYSIKDLERLSGIKAHTLRIWEKRYDLLQPKRTETNIRYYSDQDLKKLLNVSLLCNNGTKISKIVSMKEGEMKKAIHSIDDRALINQKRVDALILPALQFDEEKFNVFFKQYLEEIGIEATFTQVIYPFLEKVGLLWLSDKLQPSQEHFVTHLIRQKISAAIENLPMINEPSRKVILFLPEGEYHELGLLFFAFLYKKAGVKVFYFGQSVPLKQIKPAAQEIKPDWILSYSIIKPKHDLQKMITQMSEFTAREVFFLENKYQNDFNLSYPKTVSRLTHYQQALDKID